MTDVNQDKESAGPSASSGYDRAAGARLREAREKQGLSASAVAERLHLETRMVDALERGDEARLPEPTYVRGYLRNYARLVGVPDHEVLGETPAPTEQADAVPPRTYGTAEPVIEGWARWTGYGLALLLVVLVVVWWRSEERTAPGPPPAEPRATAEQPGQPAADSDAGVDRGAEAAQPSLESQLDLDPEDATPWLARAERSSSDDGSNAAQRPEAAAGEAQSGEGDAADTSTRAALDAASSPSNDPATREEAASGEPRADGATPSAPAPEEPAVDEAGLVELALSFDGQSWVEIKDARGERLMFDIGRVGSQRRLVGEPPFEVLLGNAPAVAMRLDGDRIDLDQHTRSNNTARFTLDVPGEN